VCCGGLHGRVAVAQVGCCWHTVAWVGVRSFCYPSERPPIRPSAHAPTKMATTKKTRALCTLIAVTAGGSLAPSLPPRWYRYCSVCARHRECVFGVGGWVGGGGSACVRAWCMYSVRARDCAGSSGGGGGSALIALIVMSAYALLIVRHHPGDPVHTCSHLFTPVHTPGARDAV
jgi:hypothetical protein